MRALSGDRNVVYVDCINVNVLVVILYCYFVSYYQREKWMKDMGDLSAFFVIAALIYNYLTIRSSALKNEGLKALR